MTAIKRKRLGAKPWRTHDYSTAERELLTRAPKGGGVALAVRIASPGFQPSNGLPTREVSAIPSAAHVNWSLRTPPSARSENRPN